MSDTQLSKSFLRSSSLFSKEKIFKDIYGITKIQEFEASKWTLGNKSGVTGKITTEILPRSEKIDMNGNLLKKEVKYSKTVQSLNLSDPDTVLYLEQMIAVAKEVQ